jgi:tetratricopeptide (TPR) repeat protein
MPLFIGSIAEIGVMGARWLRRWGALILLLGASAGVEPVAAWAQDSDDVAAINSKVAQLYKQGKYSEATEVAKRALALAEKALGPDHPDVGHSMNNLALLQKSQGRYAEAEPLYRRSLALWEKALGANHPDVGTSLNNLAMLYEDQGRYAEAEPLYRRSLGLRALIAIKAWPTSCLKMAPNVVSSRGHVRSASTADEIFASLMTPS